MDGLAALRAVPNVGSGNIAGDVFEQINSGLVKVRNNLGRILGFFFCIRPGHRVRRNDEAQGLRANARAVGDDEIAKAEQHFVFLPHGDVQEGVGADDEKEAIAVADAAEVAHGVHGIVELRAAEILTGLGKRGTKCGCSVLARETMANRCGNGARCCFSLCGGRLAG